MSLSRISLTPCPTEKFECQFRLSVRSVLSLDQAAVADDVMGSFTLHRQ